MRKFATECYAFVRESVTGKLPSDACDQDADKGLLCPLDKSDGHGQHRDEEEEPRQHEHAAAGDIQMERRGSFPQMHANRTQMSVCKYH